MLTVDPSGFWTPGIQWFCAFCLTANWLLLLGERRRAVREGRRRGWKPALVSLVPLAGIGLWLYAMSHVTPHSRGWHMSVAFLAVLEIDSIRRWLEAALDRPRNVCDAPSAEGE